MIATPTGKQAIGTLKEGDQVTAYDPASKHTSTQTVQQVFINHDTDLLDVTLSTPTPSAKPEAAPTKSKQQDAEVASHGSHAPPSTHETIHTTQKHPWLTTDNGWVKAGDLHVGEQVQRLDGSTATITALKVVAGEQDMYDLTVSQVHTFAVGDGQAVVHNCASNSLPPLSKSQIHNGLQQAKVIGSTTRTGAVVKEAGTNQMLGAARSGAPRSGIFAPMKTLRPHQPPGQGICAEFHCSVIVGARRGTSLDIFVHHSQGKGPCRACASTFQRWANANAAPIRVFWQKLGGRFGMHVWQRR